MLIRTIIAAIIAAPTAGVATVAAAAPTECPVVTQDGSTSTQCADVWRPHWRI